MKDAFRQSMAWLHTWTGLLLGWLLFAMFATGTAAYFQDEITRWMQPEVTGRPDPVVAAEGAVRFLQTTAPDAKRWFITSPLGEVSITVLLASLTDSIALVSTSGTINIPGPPP